MTIFEVRIHFGGTGSVYFDSREKAERFIREYREYNWITNEQAEDIVFWNDAFIDTLRSAHPTYFEGEEKWEADDYLKAITYWGDEKILKNFSKQYVIARDIPIDTEHSDLIRKILITTVYSGRVMKGEYSFSIEEQLLM